MDKQVTKNRHKSYLIEVALHPDQQKMGQAFKVFVVVPRGGILLKAKRNALSYESFEVLPDDYEIGPGEEIVSAQQYESIDNFTSNISLKDYLCYVPNVGIVNGGNVTLKNVSVEEEIVKFSNGENVFFFKPESLFVLPAKNSFDSIGINIFITELNKESLTEEEMQRIPERSLGELKDDDPVRIVVTEDYFTDIIPTDVRERFNFKPYILKDSKLILFISDPIIDINSEIENGLSCFKSRVVSVLKTIKVETIAPTYSFSGEFQGWDYVVFPFFSFLLGLASIRSSYILGRLVHLSQSSGYGKTRLCFEVLRYHRRGIYCVYRNPKSLGYPKTTPWLASLIFAFKKSTSYYDSMCICSQFILDAVKRFNQKDLDDDTLDMFEGIKNVVLPFNFFPISVKSRSQQTQIEMNIIDIRKLVKAPFFIVIDECDQLLIESENSDHGYSLYRILRRVLYRLKETQIVAIFLGTKSSLGDFVRNSSRDPSSRGPIEKSNFNIPAYVLTHSVDAMFVDQFLVSYEETCEVKKFSNNFFCSPRNLKNIALVCGRPLWSQYKSFSTAINVALDKLKCDDNLFRLTCFLMRTCSSVAPQDFLAHKLVLAGMATLISIDADGSRCYINFAPEPLLSNAARMALTDIDNLAFAVNDFVRRLQVGTFLSTGDAGEFVSRIILLRAMDLSVIRIQETLTYDDPKVKFRHITLLNYRNMFGKNETLVSKESKQALNQAKKEIFQAKLNTLIEVSPFPNIAAEKAKMNSSLESMQETSESSSVTPTEISPSMTSESTSMIPESTSMTPESTSMTPESTLMTPNLLRNPSDNIFMMPYYAITTLREYLVMLSDVSPDEFNNFGVSEFVLGGLVTVNQFIQMERPLIIDQAYLLHCFSRSCGIICPVNTPGIDLIIPVLRTDNCMSIVAIQSKNLNVKSFPYHKQDVSDRLKRSYLDFLNFDAIGTFDAAPNDDFVRIVFQFNSISDTTSEKGYDWVKFDTDKSALWFNGLKPFQNLFFNDERILRDLDLILANKRDFFEGVDFPETCIPTALQTTKKGAKYLEQFAQPLTHYPTVVGNDFIFRTYYEKIFATEPTSPTKRHRSNVDMDVDFPHMDTITEVKNSEIFNPEDLCNNFQIPYFAKYFRHGNCVTTRFDKAYTFTKPVIPEKHVKQVRQELLSIIKAFNQNASTDDNE